MFHAKAHWARAGVCFLLIAVLCLSACTAAPSTGDDTTTTTDPVTEPSTNGGSAMIDESIVYCAVGTVDTAAKTAKVLFADGTIDTITYTGDAPSAGVVNVFKKEGDAYTLQKTRTFPGNGDGFKNMGPALVSGRQKRLYFGGQYYYTTDDTVFFVRYSATEWRVFKGRDAMLNDSGYGVGTGARAYMYFEQPMEGVTNCRVLRYAMIVGSFAAKDKWAPANAAMTSFLDPANKGWNSGDKNLA